MIRYLEEEERRKTRQMWEEIFSTDTKEFVDYYYTYKTKSNQIMVVQEMVPQEIEDSLQIQEIEEKDGKLLAMLQLNPYEVIFGEKKRKLHYIVGVATDPLHRHQGHMKNLLHQSLKDMYDRQEPFTFLMPAAEAIYTPFDFRFIYKQNSCLLKGTAAGSSGCKEADKEDIPALIEFSNRILGERHDIYAYRTQEYYEVLLEEVKSEDGSIMLFYKDAKLEGYFFYGIGDRIEVREPVCSEGLEKEFIEEIKKSFSGAEKEVRLSGFDERLKNYLEDVIETPMIMVRIVDFKEFATFIRSKEPVNIAIRVTDPILEGNHKIFQLSSKEDLSLQAGEITGKEDVSMDVAGLAELFFGWKDIEVLYESGLITGNKNKINELKKLKITKKIFLNEVV